MKTVKIAAVIFSLLPTLFFSDNAPVGTRPLSKEAAAQIEKERKQHETGDTPEDEAELQTAGNIFDRYPPVYYSNSHHRLTLVTVLDNGEYTLTLEDGSVWKISSYDGTKALNWRIDDPLTITQNNRWFTKYDYRIINKANGTAVESSIYLGPIIGGEYSRFIARIDHSRREVMLNDNSYWDISSLDSLIFKDWDINDYVIIGTNSNTNWWNSNNTDAILINVNMNNCVRAKPF